MAEKENQQTKGSGMLQIHADITTQQGRYANLVIVNHAEEEFVLDFVLRVGGDSHLVSRVILSPPHAERLVAALAINIENRKKKIAEAQAANRAKDSRRKKKSARKKNPTNGRGRSN